MAGKQNNANSKKQKNTSSDYKGVGWNKKANKWRAKIQIDSKSKHLGYFDSEIEAAKQYDKKAKEHFGEYAKLNFPNDN